MRTVLVQAPNYFDHSRVASERLVVYDFCRCFGRALRAVVLPRLQEDVVYSHLIQRAPTARRLDI